MKLTCKAAYEAWLLRLAAAIVGGRNVARARVVSRRDNNHMFEMADELRAIAERIRRGYP